MASPNQPTTKTQELMVLLKKAERSIIEILPAYLTPEKMLRLGILATRKTPALLDCTLDSIVDAVISASQLGLEIGREAHFIPFKGKCVMIPDFRGVVNNAVRAGVVRYADARAVHKGDLFKVILGSDEPRIVHEPNLDGERNDGTLTHVYGVARLPDGSPKFDWMSREEVEKVRNTSRSKDEPLGPWMQWYGEQAKKTVIKRLFKLVPTTVDTPESRRMIATIEHDNRQESGEVSVITDFDNADGITAQTAERTRERTQDLKGKLAASTGVPLPVRTEEQERETERQLVERENKAK